GDFFDHNAAIIVPSDPEHTMPIWCYCTSPEFLKNVRKIDKKVNVTNATLVKVPFDLARWTKEARSKFPRGLPEPYSGDPTQWLFHGHPAKADRATALHIALARLAGYTWPAQADRNMRLSSGARDLIADAQTLHSAIDPGYSGEDRC